MSAFRRSPLGILVLIAGPDGSGKSTLAQKLVAESSARHRTALIHWRPGILPRPGALLGRQLRDVAKPHADSPHGPLISLGLLAWYLADFLLGSWLRILPSLRRGGLVVVERGWWDMAVDARRYRLDVPASLVRALGLLLPRPDLAILLEARSEVLAARKPELPMAEIERQLDAWTQVLPRGIPLARLDASRPLEEVAQRVRCEVDLALERRRTGTPAGWAHLPSRRSARWVVPRGPRAAARAGLLVYHPVTLRARVGWEAARLLAGAGALRLLPAGEPPEQRLQDAVGPFLEAGDRLAVASANHPGRFIVLVIDERGACRCVAKIATEERGAGALQREGAALDRLGGLARPPLYPPEIVARRPGLLVLRAIAWRPRPSPWRLPEELAFALGAFYRRGVREDGSSGPAHGDCAPWNLLRTDRGWTLIDWEDATDHAPPFYDVFHYLVQSHTLLGRPSLRAIREGLEGRGWVGRAVWGYARGSELSPSDAPRLFHAFVKTAARVRVDPEERRARRRRRRLTRMIGS